jgi:hypothetical protein
MLPRRYAQSAEELERHLEEQIRFLQTSAREFDNGHEEEAKRLATTIRVLIHDSNKSKSLLGQLGKKSVQFFDSSWDVDLDNPIPQNGITAIQASPNKAVFRALLDDSPHQGGQWVSFDVWWNKIIFVDDQKSQFTRRDVVLSVTGADGGAHVDPSLDEGYAHLSRDNALRWTLELATGSIEIVGPELAAVRQIAHEILRSLDPTMPTLKPDIPTGAVLMLGAQLSTKETPRPHPPAPKVGRNQPCPCVSGKKYKRCALRQPLKPTRAALPNP